MWEGSLTSYGKEPFDLRLTLLRMIRELPVIIGITVLGTLLFGGGYYIKNVLLNHDTTYAVTSTYRVNYVNELGKSGDYYINEMTWNTYVHSKEFLDAVWEHLQEDTMAYDSVYVENAEELSGMLEAKLASDLHVPSTIVTTDSRNRTLLIAKAVEETMVEEFAENIEQVAAIKVIDPAVTASEVIPDVRPVRAFVLSAILSLFFVVVILLLKELSDDSILLPATLRKRYGLPTVGTVNNKELAENMKYLFDHREKVAVCSVDEQVNPAEVITVLQGKLGNETTRKQDDDTMKEWIAIPAPMLCPEGTEVMRGADGVLLVVKAGRHSGKPLEYILEYLTTQEIKVTAALLWDADEWMLRTYYRLPRAVE